MKNTNIIMANGYYRDLLNKLEYLERDREFCRHNLEHFLDVARICYILSLENKYNIKKDLIYATSLLHDIGRVLEYEEGIEHNMASARIAKEILEETDFDSDEKNLIIETILSHRKEKDAENNLERIFYRADKLSRMCFKCPAINKCYWDSSKKNMEISY